MANFRAIASYLILSLLGLGYFSSQWAFFEGTAAEYAARVDQPVIRWLALFLLLGCAALLIVDLKLKRSEDEA